jgi:hypothetical protein
LPITILELLVTTEVGTRWWQRAEHVSGDTRENPEGKIVPKLESGVEARNGYIVVGEASLARYGQTAAEAI